MFRRERPQKGRFRQFHQINVEFIGVSDPFIDAEIMILLMYLLKVLGIEDLRLELNSLGCRSCRPAFRQAVTDHLKGKTERLCDDCRRRMDVNPLRVFDCKVEGCGDVIKGAPRILDFLCDGCKEHFEKVQSYLKVFDLPFHLNARMVRGLDYYTRTAFEVTTTALGAQSAVAGGGRYDRLIADLGGPDLPGIGFAIGLERLIALLPVREDAFVRPPDLFIAAIGDVPRLWAYALCNYLRLSGLRTDMSYEEKSLKSQMKRSDKLGYTFTLIIGDKEIEENKAELRNMKNGSQETISLDPFDQLAKTILSKLSERSEEVV